MIKLFQWQFVNMSINRKFNIKINFKRKQYAHLFKNLKIH